MGGKRGNLPPPPQPPIGHPVRSMQIRGDFHVEKKNGGRFTVFPPTFYMRKRRRFSPDMCPPPLPPKSDIFYLFHLFIYLYIVNLNLSPSQNYGPNPMTFHFLTGVRLAKFYICPPPNLRTLATPMPTTTNHELHRVFTRSVIDETFRVKITFSTTI